MLVKIVRTNAVSLTYESLSNDGKTINKKQTFNFISLSAEDEDFFEIGKKIGGALASGPKEILKTNVTLLEEV